MIEREKLISMVRGLQNGDPDAATKLYETFQSDIYYFILKTVNNDRELAEDLTQDTFIEILETVDKLQEPAAFVTWSKQIAYHKCTAYFRKRKELLADENEDGYSVFDTIEEYREEFIPDAALDHEDLKQTIIKMINDLPEEQKSAILLRYFNEISVKEIADIQGVTEGTVKSRLNYGRKSIKQAVEEYEKKNGIKLHCAGVLPLMLWFFKSYRVKNDLHISSNTAMQSFVIGEESAGAAAIIGSSASAAAATTATATAAVGTTVKAAAAVGGKALATKIIAGIAAAAVAIGGVSIGIASTHSHKKKTEQPVIVTYEANADSSVADQTENICLHEYLYPEFKEDDEYYAIVCDDCGVVLENNVLSCLKGGEHLWQNEYDICDSDGSRQTRRVCVICDREELHTYCADTCNHEWEDYTVVHVTLDRIHEVTRCKLCGSEIAASYPNTCSHVFDVEPQYDEQGRLTNSPKCTRCNADFSEGPIEDACDHIRVNKVPNEDNDQYYSLICMDCDTVVQNNIYENDIQNSDTSSNGEGNICDHAWEIYRVYEDGILMYEHYYCTLCNDSYVAYFYEQDSDVVCEHQLETYYEKYTDDLGIYHVAEYLQCDLCGFMELVSESEYICDHEWTYNTSISEFQVSETRSCEKCDAYEVLSSYENSCNHSWIVTSVNQTDDGSTVTRLSCELCAATDIRWEVPECAHEWTERTDYLDGTLVYQENYCEKCGEREVVYEATCIHTWESYSEYSGDILVEQGNQCSLCGVREVLYVYVEPCNHEWQEYYEYEGEEIIYGEQYCVNCGASEQIY